MPVFQVSPGINVTETDITSVIPAVGTSVGAFVGAFQWGPAEERTLVTSENDLVSIFGEPDSNTYDHFFTAANFLAYADNLQVVRVIGSLAANAVVFQETTATDESGTSSSSSSSNSDLSSQSSSSSSSTNDHNLVKNATDYENASLTGLVFIAKYPGSLGNGLHVSICDTSVTFAKWVSVVGGVAYDQATNFSSAPGTSDYVSNRNGSSDEMHIIIRDADGRWSGTKGTILEKFEFVSKASDAKKSDGTSNYYKDVLNRESAYIWWASHVSGGTNWGNTSTNTVFGTVGAKDFNFHLGVDDNANVVDADLTDGWALFADSETVDVNLLISGPASATVAGYIVDDVADVRKDCVAFISPLSADVVNNSGSEHTAAVTTRNTLTSSSYVVFDGNWKYQYDRYNDTYRWLPLNGDIAGLCAQTDETNDPWFSPAGPNRGQIKNVVKLAYNPTKAQRDYLYKAGVNPVVTFAGQGTILYGDKTMLSKPSSFGQIGVRRLFNILEKSISTYAKYSLFEFNDEFTRSQFKSTIEPYLRDVQGRRGITDFRVICDTTNNTEAVVSAQRFVADIFIRPNNSINYIQLNFIASQNAVDFQEVTAI